MKIIIQIIMPVLLCLFVTGASIEKNTLPQLFLFLGGADVALYKNYLSNKCIDGTQIIYSWKQLEPQKDIYDFSKIKADLRYLAKTRKKLFIQLQDRSFEPTVFNVPDYILDDPIYHGGAAMQYDFPGEGKSITTGWVARVWDPAVRKRFQLLIKKLGKEFDGKIYGINLPETAVDFDEHNLPKGFTPNKYFYGVLENLSVLRTAFHQSIVVQYVNFFPGEWNNDHHYMSRLFSYAVDHQIALGGPDVVPYKTAHMQNSYPFFHKSKKQLFTSIAIQEPDYSYKNPETDEAYTFTDFYNFTQEFLGANIVFWNVQEPFYSNELFPKMDSSFFQCYTN